MSNAIMIYTQEQEMIYLRSSAARLAGVSEDFLIRCEQEELITCISDAGGKTGLDRKAIRRLSLIKRLQRDLALDFETIDLVLHLRRQVIDLQDELNRLERLSRQKELRLLAELQELRRELTQDGRFNGIA